MKPSYSISERALPWKIFFRGERYSRHVRDVKIFDSRGTVERNGESREGRVPPGLSAFLSAIGTAQSLEVLSLYISLRCRRKKLEMAALALSLSLHLYEFPFSPVRSVPCSHGELRFGIKSGRTVVERGRE